MANSAIHLAGDRLLAHETPAAEPTPHAAPATPTSDTHHHPADAHAADGDAAHEHGMIEISAGQPVPAVDLTIHPDPLQGWNLEVNVTNFQFAPDRLDQPSDPAEGHAHLYVNGEKITRLYGNWYYLESLPPGRHEITVSLNANGHEALMHNGQPIADTEVLDVAANDTLEE